MARIKINKFESMLLVLWLAVAALGFQFINKVYSIEGQVSWLMVIAVFNWLMFLILFISLSLTVDITKKQLDEVRGIAEELRHRRRKLI